MNTSLHDRDMNYGYRCKLRVISGGYSRPGMVGMARQLQVLSMRDAEYFVMLAIVELNLSGSVNETTARRITAHCSARARKRGKL